MKIKISKEANENYLAKIVKLKNLRKHSNADRLQVVDIDFQSVITDLTAKDGDLYVFFPIESKINEEFVSFINGFRHSNLNADKDKTGFFEDNCRVRAVKLRGEKSMGFIVPVEKLLLFYGVDVISDADYEGQEFDVINGIKILEKYIIRTRTQGIGNKNKIARKSRLIDGQVNFHTDTSNLRKNVHVLNPDDIISITYKVHGTSWHVSNVLVKRKLSWFETLLKWFGIKIDDKEYDIVYGTRRTIKNGGMVERTEDDFYKSDLWGDIRNLIGQHIPKGFAIYGEALGFTKEGKAIQKDYDYGCNPNEFRLEIYRITQTNKDGLVTELSNPEIREFCEKTCLTPSHLFYYGKASEYVPVNGDIESWRETLIKTLESEFNEKDCFMCNNKVPEEGIVLRRESLFGCHSYKLKSFAFLEKETKMLDNGEIDIESDEEQTQENE